MKKILYGCCYIADLDQDNITYVDIIPGLIKSHNCIYICDTIENINFNDYDIIICSPPCNYYSRANYRRNTSNYSQKTKHLLPYCINAAFESNKPFIIENVRNDKLFNELDLPKGIFIYKHGRHTYFTNRMINVENIEQKPDNIKNISSKKRQGGENVNNVFKYFIELYK